MDLDFAVDALYQTGWTPPADETLPRDTFGRAYPSPEQVAAAFADQGLVLTIRHIQLFDCYRAEWKDAVGQARGAVVGRSAEESAVYALSQLRRQMASV
jgi:hypothetical protein